MREIFKQDLQADSKRNATYSLTVHAVDEGFVVETRRGASGKMLGRETYWRPTAAETQKLIDRIQKQKSRPGRARVYRPVEEEQYPLFRALAG